MPLTDYEERRLAALRRFGLLDSPPEEVFDGITLALANICAVPIALISLIDEDRQWFKSAYGLKIKQTPREVSFCSKAILNPDRLTIIEDATQESRFAGNPLVTQSPNIRFYAGKPIISPDGYPLGTLCVIDRKPRHLEAFQLETLEALAASVTGILAERLRLQKVAIDRDDVESLVRQRADRVLHLYEDREALLQSILDWLQDATAVVNSSGVLTAVNAAWKNLVTEAGSVTGLDRQNDGFIAQDFAELRLFGAKDEAVSAGFQDILAGKIDRFEIECPGRTSRFRVTVTPLSSPAIGAIIQLAVTEVH